MSIRMEDSIKGEHYKSSIKYFKTEKLTLSGLFVMWHLQSSILDLQET